MSNFMKTRPVGAEVFYADGRTDRHDEVNSRLSQLRESAVQRIRLLLWTKVNMPCV